MAKLDDLLQLASLGLALFPCTGKRPLTTNGLKDASKDPDQIKAWHTQFPRANWGMATGSASGGILVVDLDRHMDEARRCDGLEAWDDLKRSHDHLEEDGPRVATPSGGEHIYYLTKAGTRNTAGKLAHGIDTRGSGGYVLIPPSAGYTWSSSPFDFWPPPEPPAFVVAALKKVKAKPKETVPQGERHTALVKAAGVLGDAGLAITEITEELSNFRETTLEAGTDPTSDLEILAAAEWAADKEHDPRRTDVGNAERLAANFGHLLRFVPEWDRWIIWDGKRWAPDAAALTVRFLAHRTARQMLVEAATIAADETRNQLINWSQASENTWRISAMIKEATALPDLVAPLATLNTNPLLLNCQNGTLDLTTATLRPHSQLDLITRITHANYDPDATAPCWSDFLDTVTGGDADLALFLQLFAGYALTGLVSEDALAILYGPGANGKSTFVETLRRLLGDYASRTVVDALLMARNAGDSGPTPYVVALEGKRLVIGSELPEGRRLNERLVKDLTSGDALTGRGMYGHPMTFLPTHKLMLMGNHLPKIVGTDEGIWRRVYLAPFSVVIPKERRRPMHQLLAEFQAEGAGILTWMVEGCLLWQADGLIVEGTVATATKAYRRDEDAVAQFLEDTCDVHPDHQVLKGDLFRAWQAWLRANNEADLERRSRRWFIQQLVSRGFQAGGHQRDSLTGLRLDVPMP